MTDYARKTKDEIYEVLKQAALEVFPDSDWSGLRTGSFEDLLARLVAETSDLNGYYLDQRAKNAYINTANVRKDIRDIAANLGLFPRERAGATTTLTITTTDTVTIPIGTRFSSSNGVIFAGLNELTITGASTGSLLVVNADYSRLTYRSRGDSSEVIDLKKPDVLIENLVVQVSGEEWSRVDNFGFTDATSKVYVATFDERNRVKLLFGNGVYGKRLPADASVLVDIFYGGGTAGNSVIASDITSMLDSFTNSSNVSTITNSAAPTGGRGADSIDNIRSNLPAQLSQIAGLISKEQIAKVIKANLTWVADASAEFGYSKVSGRYVPIATVAAYPYGSTITSMSAAQSSELSDFLASRGQLGIGWSAQDAYGAPVELEIEVKLSNRNLSAQKEAEIKAALVDNTDAPFYFDNLGFEKEYSIDDIIAKVKTVSGVVSVKVNKFAKIPQSIVTSGTVGTDLVAGSDSAMSVLELGEEAEDGYFHFVSYASEYATTHFMRPVMVDVVGSDWVRSSAANWLVEEYTFNTGSDLDDTDGPWVKPDTQLSFKQTSAVWKTDQFNGSNYLGKYLLKVSWADDSDVVRTAYYHIGDTTANTITTVENANSPISGTSISATLADADYSKIIVQILQDQSNGNTNGFVTASGDSFAITHNNHNTLWLGSAPTGKVPTSQYSYIHFDDTDLDTTSDSWTSTGDALRMRLHISEPFAVGDIVNVYTSKLNANTLKIKHPKEVFTLAKSNIVIRFV